MGPSKSGAHVTQRRSDRRFNQFLELVGAKVRQQRTALGLTQAQLGNRAQMTDKFVSRVETDGENLTLSSLTSLANALQLDPGDLLPRENSCNEPRLAQQCKAIIDAVGDDEELLGMMLDLLKTAHKHS